MSNEFYKTNNIELLKGDCIKILDNIEKDSVDMIFADPPYFLSSGGITCKSGKIAKVDKGDWDKTVDFKEKYEFNKSWISKCKEVLTDNGTIWISGTVHNIYVIGFVLEELGFKIINNITWQKTNPPPNMSCRYFTHSTETILWAKKNIKKAKHTYNYDLMKEFNDNKQMKDVWSSSTTSQKEKKFGKHPTQKPEWLLERIILASTNEGDKVLDPFNGSGTTGVMCKKVGRKYIGIDINEEYLNISKQRIENINIQEYTKEIVKEDIQVEHNIDNNQISFEDMYIYNINEEINYREEDTVNMSIVKNKPFLKWAGGKTQLLSVLEENLPEKVKIEKRLNTYIEPFVGAGAFFIYLASNYEFDRIIINDLNYKLINVYKVIKSNCEELIDKLSKMREEYLQYDEEQQKEMYLKVRDEFNNWESVDKVKQAANFIFINKTCFNGLYRENQKGGYNVPWGQQKNPSMYDEEQLRSMSKLLNQKENGKDKIVILNGDYRKVEDYIDDNTLVYIDPPYRPVTKGGFNSYNKSGFNDDAQRELSEFYRDINSRGAKVMLSNSDPKNLDDNDEFFDNLYEGFNIQRVSASRMINSNGKGRGNITEILVKNY